MSGTERNSEKYMQDFTDLKAKFQNILERDNVNKSQQSQRATSAQGQAKADDVSEATAPMVTQPNEDEKREPLPQLTPSDTIPLQMSGESLDIAAIVSEQRTTLKLGDHEAG